MSVFEVKLSGNSSYGISKTVCNTLLHLNDKYLNGKRGSAVVVIEYLDRGLWFVEGQSLENHRNNMIIIKANLDDDITEDESAAFVLSTFHAFEDVIGDLHHLSCIQVMAGNVLTNYYLRFVKD